MSKHSLTLHQSEIKCNPTENKYFVETDISMKLASFETSGKVMQGAHPASDPGTCFSSDTLLLGS